LEGFRAADRGAQQVGLSSLRHCGWLDKKKDTIGWDKRWFEIRGTRLRYLEERGVIELARSGNQLNKVTEDPLELRLTSELRGTRRTLRLRAQTEELRDAWFDAISAASEVGGGADAGQPALPTPLPSPAVGAAVMDTQAQQDLARSESPDIPSPRVDTVIVEETAARTELQLEAFEQLTSELLRLAAEPLPIKARNDTGRAVVSFADVEDSLPAERTMTDGVPSPSKRQTGNSTEALIRAIRTGDWKEGKKLGEGQFGVVKMAMLPGGNCLAVKQIKAADLFSDGDEGEEARDAYRKEVAVMAQLSHPNVVKYYGTAVGGETLSLFMEYVPGGSLGDLARGLEHDLDERTVATYARQVLLGLQYLHRNQILHRDVKGDNVLLDPSQGIVKLTDFGSARRLQQSMMGGMSVAGTPNFMSPEIITAGEDAGAVYNNKVDVWSFGCTVVELLSGGTPPWSNFNNPWACIYHITNTTESPADKLEATPLCKAFLGLCFKRVPSERATVQDLLEHEYICQAPEVLDTEAMSAMNAVGTDVAAAFIDGKRMDQDEQEAAYQ